jgi:predicted nucleic acid-binding protein
VKTFVDTNILLYAHDSEAGRKGEIASERIKRLWESGDGVLSLQVLQEFYVNVTRKIPRPLTIPQAREILRVYQAWINHHTTIDTVLRATEISELAQISFWDSLIVASAEHAGCGELLSEDLNTGQVIAGVKVVNPFTD